jgi:hypothetical protein
LKKAVAVLMSVILALGLSSCGKDSGGGQQAGEPEKKQEKKVYKTVDPEKVLTMENVSALVSYAPVLEKSKSGKAATALYRSEPVGQGDVVQIDVYQPSARVSEDEVKQLFSEEKEKRPKAEDVSDLGAEAFIAIPSIHLMKNGYYVKITAGSGGGDEQKTLLRNAAQTALANLDGLLK